ncbi:hypothetical protein BB558_003037 [Smittium angustum]|uniref:ABC transporter domain-containing protein n=1 Tax=Smittium angustum TaxID=133377 RepID=A0A2U1J721_SMIAN|nr:hypothetical protein BB558_003037 [Smittium angustum]
MYLEEKNNNTIVEIPRTDIQNLENNNTTVQQHHKNTKVLRCPPAEIVFENLTYKVDIKTKTSKRTKLLGCFKNYENTRSKTILDSITGSFKPGKLTAIIGPSGSGKTSLLNLLSGRIGSGNITGNIWLNGRNADNGSLKLVSRYISQEDVMLPTMTVKEIIEMAIRFRIDKITEKELEERLNDAVETLELQKCLNTQIGDSISKGISGGEKKRTSIAMDMATNSSILFLDEPTSGLDIYTSLLVTKLLRSISRTGQTVVSVIHQPSSDIFSLFDEVMVLSEGKIVYFDKQKSMVPYFNKIGYQCPMYTNPADFVFTNILNPGFSISPTNSLKSSNNSINDNASNFVNIDGNDKSSIHNRKNIGVFGGNRAISINKTQTDHNIYGGDGTRTKMEEKERTTEYLAECWKNSDEFKKEKNELFTLDIENSKITEANFTSSIRKSKQFTLLLKRAGKNMLRNKLMVRVRILQSIVVGLILGIVFYQSNKNPPVIFIQNILGALFFSTITQFIPVAINVLSTFSSEKHVFQREEQSGYYQLTPYFFSKIIVELPIQILGPLIFTSISYYMVGFRNPFYHFVIHFVALTLLAFNAFSIGLLVSCLVSNLAVALSLLPMALIIPIMFGGFLVNSGSLMGWISWLQWVSPVKYGFTMLAINQLKDLQINGIPIGNAELKRLNLGPFGIGECAAFLLMFFAIFTTLAYIGLELSNRKASGKTFAKSNKKIKEVLMGPPDPRFTNSNQSINHLHTTY